jgi:hypothetical protein
VPSRDLIPLNGKESLTLQSSTLSPISPELEWLANITNTKTRRRFYKPFWLGSSAATHLVIIAEMAIDKDGLE